MSGRAKPSASTIDAIVDAVPMGLQWPALRVMTADGIDLTSILMMVSPPMPGPDGVQIGPLKADDYRITVAMPEGPRQGTIDAAEGETAVLDLR